MALHEAINSDRLGALVEAAAQYEALLDVDDSLRVRVDLAVLYWTATDPGMAGRVPLAFFRLAARRFPALLDEARARFPRHAEPAFWQRYIDWADLGSSLTVQDCAAMLQQDPQCLVPAMHIFASTCGEMGRTQALELLRQCQVVGTTRDRYIQSVIEGVMYREPKPIHS